MKKTLRIISILTLISLLLILWEFSIYRKTFIQVYIPIFVMVIGGFSAFLIFRKKINYYINLEHNFYLQALHGIILFGGVLMYLFMALNFYIPVGKDQILNLKVIEIGKLSTRRRSCEKPYAIVDYKGFEKQLIFPCYTDLQNSKSIKVSMRKGMLGFLIIDEMELIH